MTVTVKFTGAEGSGKTLISNFIKDTLSKDSNIAVESFKHLRKGCLPDEESVDNLKIIIKDFGKFAGKNSSGRKNYMLITTAYTIDTADCIGDEEWAEKLQTMGINPELKTPESKVCSIGFCEKEQKWYGWSHRAMYGFGIGSEVKKGDCGYKAANRRDFQHGMLEFWKDEKFHLWTTMENVYGQEGVWGVEIKWRYNEEVPNKKLWNTESNQFTPYPEKYGKGEWKAGTLEDAKQMAMDFADGVN